LNFREIARAWLPVFLWMALMFLGSTDLMSAEHTSRFLTPFLRWLTPDLSPAAIAQVHFFVRKAAHVSEYAILAWLLLRAGRSLLTGFWRRAAASAVPAMLFAAADEFHQSFVVSRTSSLGDVLLDWSGALLGVMIYGMLSSRRCHRKHAAGKPEPDFAGYKRIRSLIKRIHEGGATERPGQPHGMIGRPDITGKQDLDGID
jgi:VanZ family protein